MMNDEQPKDWLCLAIGNSRLHWAWFQGEQLQVSWHTPHLTASVVNNTIPAQIFPDSLLADRLSQLPICLVSVVPSQTSLWQNYTHLWQIALADIPLTGIYPSLGIDRALAVWGAGKIYGFPCLVIDAGTALTFTGVDDRQQLIGGAILPGFRLQFRSLSSGTSALPNAQLPEVLPNRWALTTTEAINSGIVYTVLAGINDFIADWTNQFPQSKIIFTGGDATFLAKYWQQHQLKENQKVIYNTNLIFYSMRLVYLS